MSRRVGSFPDVTSPSQLRTDRPSAGRVRHASRPVTEDFATLVRGYGFAAPPPGWPGPREGDPAELVREPANPRDPLAVAVWLTAGTPWRIGYLDRAVAARLAPRLDAGQPYRAELAGWVEVPETDRSRPLVRVRTVELPSEGALADGRGPSLWGRPPRSSRRIVTPGR